MLEIIASSPDNIVGSVCSVERQPDPGGQVEVEHGQRGQQGLGPRVLVRERGQPRGDGDQGMDEMLLGGQPLGPAQADLVVEAGTDTVVVEGPACGEVTQLLGSRGRVVDWSQGGQGELVNQIIHISYFDIY